MDRLIKQLAKNNIRFKEFSYYAPYFRKRWEDAFVHHLSKLEKEKIFLYGDRYFCGYLWHIFSNDKRPYIMQNAANEAFDAQKKAKCYVFHQRLSEVLVIEQATNLKSLHLEHSEDLFIVDEDFTWTYVVTHESEFGPYFSKTKELPALVAVTKHFRDVLR